MGLSAPPLPPVGGLKIQEVQRLDKRLTKHEFDSFMTVFWQRTYHFLRQGVVFRGCRGGLAA
jgi:hypothetical protein